MAKPKLYYIRSRFLKRACRLQNSGVHYVAVCKFIHSSPPCRFQNAGLHDVAVCLFIHSSPVYRMQNAGSQYVADYRFIHKSDTLWHHQKLIDKTTNCEVSRK